VLPIPLEGYWVDRSSYEYAGTVYACPRDTCKGDSGGVNTARSSVSTHVSTASAGAANDECWTYGNYSTTGESGNCNDASLLCKEGSYGPLCGACSEEYVYNVVINSCEKCKHNAENVLLYIGIAMVTMVVSALFFCVVVKNKVFKGSFVHRNNIMVKLLANVDSGSLKVIWVTYQIIVSSSLSLNIKV
jgi:hypothetical protein